MKNAFKKMTSICAAVVLSFSVVSCGSSEEKGKEKEKTKSADNSPEVAVQRFVQGLYDADADDICEAMAPDELWNYISKDTGISKDKVLKRLLGTDNLEDFPSLLDSMDVKVSEIEIKEKHDESDDAYNAFGQAMSKAGIDKNINHLYYVEPGPVFNMDGFAYEINNNWYFGPEDVMEDLIDVAIEGYSALPDEVNKKDEDYNYDFDYDFDDIFEDGYDVPPETTKDVPPVTTEQKSKPESNEVNLCTDSSCWASWSSEEDNCAANLKILSDGAALEVTKANGEYLYYNQLKYENIVLEEGATYRLEFDYEGTENIEFEFLVQQNYEPFSYYIAERIEVSSRGSSHYSTQFTMPETDDDSCIAFNSNNHYVATPYSLAIHNLTLVRVS